MTLIEAAGDDSKSDSDLEAGDSNASESEFEVSSSSSDEECEQGQTIKSILPAGYTLQAHPPSRIDKKLMGAELVMRWSTGWYMGRVIKYFTVKDRKTLQRDRDMNLDIMWIAEQEVMEHAVSIAQYSNDEDASNGCWALCIPPQGN